MTRVDSPVPLTYHDPDRPWITDPDPDHSKGTQPKSLRWQTVPIKIHALMVFMCCSLTCNKWRTKSFLCRGATLWNSLPCSLRQVRSLDRFDRFKVTVCLQGCLAYKRCSASGFYCRHLKPYIKLKLTGLAVRQYQQF